MARSMAGVSLVDPSPVAPKARTLNVADLKTGNGKLGGVNGSLATAAEGGDTMVAISEQRAVRRVERVAICVVILS